MLVTVVETPEFIKQAAGLLSEKELDELKYHLSATPRAGDVLQGTGGVRKLRWAAKGKGKSGGVRDFIFIDPPQADYFCWVSTASQLKSL